MTRFEKELSGQLGDFWKREAEREIEKMQNYINNGEILLDENAAVYWKSNGAYLPSNCVEVLRHTGFFFDEEATTKARKEQTAKFIEDYCKNHKPLSNEDRMEMRNAFGKGTRVVNVITGEVYIA